MMEIINIILIRLGQNNTPIYKSVICLMPGSLYYEMGFPPSVPYSDNQSNFLLIFKLRFEREVPKEL